jgi:hypothetical protein
MAGFNKQIPNYYLMTNLDEPSPKIEVNLNYNKAARAIMNIPPKIVMFATIFLEYLSARCAIKKQSIPLNTNHTPIDILFIYRRFLIGQ